MGDANAGCFYSFIEEMLQCRGLATPEQFLAEDFCEHFGDELRDRGSFVASLTEHIACFPAASWTIEILASVQDVVICHVRTQPVDVARATWENFVARFDNGRIVECWRSCHGADPDVTANSGSYK